MKFRLTAYVTGTIFTMVVVAAYFARYHNPNSPHMDTGLVSHLEQCSRKVKKHFHGPAVLSAPLRLVYNVIVIPVPVYDSFSIAYSTPITVSCRAPPA